MRVVVASHMFPTVERPIAGLFVRKQVEALAAAGAEVSVFAPQYPGAEPEPPEGLAVPVSYPSLPWGPAMLPSRARVLRASLVYRRRLREYLRAGRRPEMLHAHYGFPDGAVAASVARSMGLPCVVTLHGDDVHFQLARAVSGRLVRRVLLRAGRIVVVSPHMLDGLERMGADLARRAVWIPNGYDAVASSAGDEGLGRRGLVYVGRLSPEKGVDRLLKAFAKSRMADRLVLVGAGPEETRLRGLAAALELGERVEFAGMRPNAEAMAMMAGARALVLASDREGLPSVAVEALACGTPVVAAAVGGLPDLLRDERVGILVPPGDDDALAAALDDASSREWLHTAIRSLSGVLSWDEVAGRLLELYDEVIAEMGGDGG